MSKVEPLIKEELTWTQIDSGRAMASFGVILFEYKQHGIERTRKPHRLCVSCNAEPDKKFEIGRYVSTVEAKEAAELYASFGQWFLELII